MGRLEMYLPPLHPASTSTAGEQPPGTSAEQTTQAMGPESYELDTKTNLSGEEIANGNKLETYIDFKVKATSVDACGGVTQFHAENLSALTRPNSLLRNFPMHC